MPTASFERQVAASQLLGGLQDRTLTLQQCLLVGHVVQAIRKVFDAEGAHIEDLLGVADLLKTPALNDDVPLDGGVTCRY